MDEMTADEVARLFRAVGKVLPALTSVVGRTDSLVAVHNGPAAGQEVPHVHVHVVPRSTEDGAGPIHSLFTRRPQVSKEENEALADRIQSIATPS
jgi:histidine triad (HIT) family protein